MKPPYVSVLLADDHDVVRAGVRAILESRDGWLVCAEAATGTQAVKLAAELHPDIVVLDMEMGELDGLSVTRQIKRSLPETEVLIFTMHDNESLIQEVFSAGAHSFILKSEGAQALIKAIEHAVQHKPFLAPRASETLLNTLRRSNDGEVSPLTDRECEIVRLVATGKSNKETARMLGISVKTVETHRAAIMRKLGFSSIVNLVRYAVRKHFIKA